MGDFKKQRPLALAVPKGGVPKMLGGIGRLDRARDDLVAGHQGLMDRIHQNSDIVAAARAAKPMLQPYLA